MKTLTILVPQIKPPFVKDTIITQFQNIFNHMEANYDLKIIWIIFQENPFHTITKDNWTIVDFHNYNNALEILDEFNPDLVMLEVRLSMNSIMFKKAAEYKQIPTITISPTGQSEKFGKLFSIKSMQNLIFLDKVVASTQITKKHKFAMLSYSLKRYIFMLQTLKAIGYSFLNLIQFIIFYPRIHIMSNYYPALNKITEGNLNICFNVHWFDRLKKEGFNIKNILLEGDPVFDKLYSKISSLTPPSKNKQTKILLCSTPMHELGWMTKHDHEKLILHIIKNVTSKNNFELSIKIHPSSSSFYEYESILKKSNAKVKLFQKEDTINLINENDVILVYGSSTVILDAVLVKKPIILLSVSNEKFNRLYDPYVMKECKNLDQINSLIELSKDIEMTENAYNNYLKLQIGKFDGNNAKQIASHICNLLEKLGK